VTDEPLRWKPLFSLTRVMLYGNKASWSWVWQRGDAEDLENHIFSCHIEIRCRHKSPLPYPGTSWIISLIQKRSGSQAVSVKIAKSKKSDTAKHSRFCAG
jgi:hypothetical protein